MAKRFTDTEMWDKEWFMSLPCKLKCLVKMVRDKCDLCGVWSPNWIIATAYVGEKVNEQELINIDNGNQFKKLENGKIYCVGFVEFQYGKLSEKSPVHNKIIGLLEQNKILETYNKIPYQHPINRVLDKEEEEYKEKDKEIQGKIKIIENTNKELTELEIALNEFKKMRVSIKRKMTDHAFNLILKELEKLAPNNEQLKIDILNQSIKNSWQDVYPLKQNANFAKPPETVYKNDKDKWSDPNATQLITSKFKEVEKS